MFVRTHFSHAVFFPSARQHSLEGWRKVFWLAAGISLFGTLFYSIFGSAKMQPWAMTEEEREEAEQKRIRSAST